MHDDSLDRDGARRQCLSDRGIKVGWKVCADGMYE